MRNSLWEKLHFTSWTVVREVTPHRNLCSKQCFTRKVQCALFVLHILIWKHDVCEHWKPSFWFKLYFLPKTTSAWQHTLLALILWRLTTSYSNPQLFWAERDACNSSLGGDLRVHVHLSRLVIVRELPSHRTLCSSHCSQRQIQSTLCVAFFSWESSYGGT